jgi:small subunit ribosomal protein S16
MVKLRLARAGAKKHPFYRVVVADARSPRDGRFIEQVGIYNPMKDPAEFLLKQDRVDHWLGKGAQATESVRRLILKHRKQAATQ